MRGGCDSAHRAISSKGRGCPAELLGAPLSCSIIQQRRSKQTKYYSAISYAWGEPEFARNLEIRCGDDTSYLRITLNVETLLRHLRAPKGLRYLWLDSVCLNQADELEKAQQIPLMGHIYEEARYVHIWLGPRDHMTAKLFEFFREIGRLPQVRQARMAELIVGLMREILGSNHFVYISDFSERAWFSRRWIIQEACLARQAVVHCGSCSIPLPWLALAATRLQALDISWYEMKVMANLRRLTTKKSMLELLWHFHEAGCLEPKDRIAALVGLVPDGGRPDLNYLAHWTDIYKRVASFMFGLGDNDTGLQMLFHLFEFGPVSRPDDISYPSWVPDWSRTRRRRLPYYSDIRNPDTYEPYPTSPGNSQHATLTFHHGNLRIHWHASIAGIRGRQVIRAKKFDSPPQGENQRAKRVIDTLDELFPSGSVSVLQMFALSSLLQIIIYFRHSARDRGLDTPSFDTYIGDVNKKQPKPLPAELFNSLGKTDALLEEHCLFELNPYVPMSESSGGGYGIGSHEIQVGDIMIPLWQLEWKPHQSVVPGDKSIFETAIHTTTMLAVRPVGEQPPQSETSVTDGDISVQKGSIIGPAVCIIPGGTGSYGEGSSVDVSWDRNLDKEQLYSMSLI